MLITVYGKGGSGKTTVAMHLAKVFASHGKSVLLMSIETRYGALPRALGVKVPEEKSLVNALLDAANSSYYQNLCENIEILSLADTDTVSKCDIITNVLSNEEVLPRFTKDILSNFDVVIVDGTERLTDLLNYHFAVYADKIINVVDARPEGLAYYNAHKGLKVLEEKEILLINKMEESIANKSTVENVLARHADMIIPFNLDIIKSSYRVEMNKKLLKRMEQLYAKIMGIETKKKGFFAKKKKEEKQNKDGNTEIEENKDISLSDVTV